MATVCYNRNLLTGIRKQHGSTAIEAESVLKMSELLEKKSLRLERLQLRAGEGGGRNRASGGCFFCQWIQSHSHFYL